MKILKLLAIFLVGFVLLTGYGYASVIYEYYPSGNVKSITYDPAENGVEYEEFLDEDLYGVGYNWFLHYCGASSRIIKKVLLDPDTSKDDALSFTYDYASGGMWVADLDGDGIEELINVYEELGLYKYQDDILTKIGLSSPDTVTVANLDGVGGNELVLTYDNLGLYKYQNGILTRLGPSTPDTVTVANLDGVGGDELVLTYDNLGLYKYQNGILTRLGPSIPETITVVDLDGDGEEELVLTYENLGLYKYQNGILTRLGPSIPETITVVDLDGVGGDELVLTYETLGLYKYQDGLLTKLGPSTPDTVTVANLDGVGGDELVLTYENLGLYKYQNGTLTKLGPSIPETITVVDLDGDGEEELILTYENLGLYKYQNGILTKIGPSIPETITVVDLDGDGVESLILTYENLGLYKYQNGILTKIGPSIPETITVVDLDGDGGEDLVLAYENLGLYKYQNGILTRLGSSTPISIQRIKNDNVGVADYLVLEYESLGLLKYQNGIFTKIGSTLPREVTATEYAYLDDNYQDLIYTATYDASGNSISKVYNNQYSYYGGEPDLLKRKIEGATGNVYEYENDNAYYNNGSFGRPLVESSHTDVTLGGRYDTSAWYRTYDWETESVTVSEYDGEYSVDIDAAVGADVDTTETRVAYTYIHNSSYSTTTQESNWARVGKAIYDTNGEGDENIIEAYMWYVTGSYDPGEESLMKAYVESGVSATATEWDNTGAHKIITSASYTTTFPLVAGVYTPNDNYKTYDWNDTQVLEKGYEGAYEVSSLYATRTDVVPGELRYEKLYDHHNGYGINDDAWVKREEIVYDTDASTKLSFSEYYTSGGTKRSYNGKQGSEYEENGHQAGYFSYEANGPKELYGGYFADNSYNRYYWDNSPEATQVEVVMYDGVYTVDIGDDIGVDIDFTEKVVRYTYDHHGAYNVHDESWVMREQSIVSEQTTDVTAVGNAHKDTGEYKFGTASASFDGSGDYLSVPNSHKWYIEEGNSWTIDLCVNLTSGSFTTTLISSQDDYETFSITVTEDQSQIGVYINGEIRIFETGGILSEGMWHHIALVSQEGVVNGYIDGYKDISPAEDWDISSLGDIDIGAFYIGQASEGSFGMNGHIDDFRISDDALWNNDFYDALPSTEPVIEEETLFLMNANGADGATDFSSTTFDETEWNTWDEFGRKVQEADFAENTYSYYEYFTTGDYTSKKSYKEEYTVLGRTLDTAYWYYENATNRIKQKAVVTGGEAGTAYQYFDAGQTGPGDWYAEIKWEGDYTATGYVGDYTVSPYKTLWKQIDTPDIDGIQIDGMEVYEYYTGGDSGQFQWKNLYGWYVAEGEAEEMWHYYMSYEFDTEGKYIREENTHIPAFGPGENNVPADQSIKPEPTEAGIASTTGQSYYASEDGFLSDDIRSFFEKVDVMKSECSGSGVFVAILDSGINTGETECNVIGGYDFAGGNRYGADEDDDYSDDQGHGTVTAEVINATAGDVDVLALKVMDDYGKTTSSILSDAIRYAVDMGAKVLAMPFTITPVNSLVYDAVDYAVDKGTILIASAGNDGEKVKEGSLASLDNVITVGSVDNDGKLSAWSNCGEEVDLYAPWDVIDNEAGTSFSAAFVSGIAAIMLENNPGMTKDDVLSELKILMEDFNILEEDDNNNKKVEDEVMSKMEILEKSKAQFSGYGIVEEDLVK